MLIEVDGPCLVDEEGKGGAWRVSCFSFGTVGLGSGGEAVEGSRVPAVFLKYGVCSKGTAAC